MSVKQIEEKINKRIKELKKEERLFKGYGGGWIGPNPYPRLIEQLEWVIAMLDRYCLLDE